MMISLPLLVYVYLSSAPPLPPSVSFPPSSASFLSSHSQQSAIAFALCRGITLPCQRESLPHACLSRFFLPLLPPIPRFIPLWPVSSSLSLCTPTLSLFLHSSVLNALPLSTLESERSSLLWRRRGIWIRSNIRGLRLLFS